LSNRHFGYRGNGSVGKQRKALKDLTASDKALSSQVERLE
jgi:hypothetical protein